MEDREIVALFRQRSERAIAELAAKYGRVCHRVAENILRDRRDAEECVNDAYLGVWNTVPSASPDPLVSYVCRIVHNQAVMKYHAAAAQKRNSHYDVALDELEDCFAAPETAETALAASELSAALDRFLDTLPREERVLFVRRYWFADSMEELAQRFHISRNHAAVRLARTRGKLKNYLRKEGYEL